MTHSTLRRYLVRNLILMVHISLTLTVTVIFLLYYSCIQTQVKPVLDKLNVDSDVDVKYFASEAIAGIAGKQLNPVGLLLIEHTFIMNTVCKSYVNTCDVCGL